MIRNPEVQGLVPALLKAIADPNAHTRPALDALLETVFVNTIDAASLVRESPSPPLPSPLLLLLLLTPYRLK